MFMTKVRVMKADITGLVLDAIVNAANASLLGGGGVDGAIHRQAGPGLLAECRRLGGCKTGQAKITGGYKLPVEYVIHTVGPVYREGHEDSCHVLLSECYTNSLLLAQENGIKTIGFPCISAGVYGYPKEEAASTAVQAIDRFLAENPDFFEEIIFVVFDDENLEIYQRILKDFSFAE
jgi:O-acetyl-ADP-ribose deacetylase